MSLKKCLKCKHLCCNYITVKIPAPRTIIDFDGLLWQVAHENISAFRDHTGWHLLVDNPCKHLNDEGKCSIYENRPITCRQHSAEYCEFDSDTLEAAHQYFSSYEQLDAYCSKKFKTWEKRFEDE